MFYNKSRLSFVAILLAGVSPLTPAMANTSNTDSASESAPAAPPTADPQDASANQSGIGDIIVTAQRRSENLQKVPIAVTAVQPKALETAGVASSLDLPRVAPGLTVAPTVANAILVPYLRGVGSNSPATGNDSSIAVYIDGVYQSDKLSNILDLADVDRIEVLKGPQGTLFGRNATGGAINIITRQPHDTLSGDAEVSYQRFDRFSAKGFLTGPLADNLSASLAVAHSAGGAYLTNTGPDTPGKFGSTRNDGVDFKLRYHSGRLDVTAGVMYVDRSTNDLGSNLYAVPGTTPVGVLAGGTVNYNLYQYAGSPNLVHTQTYRATLKAKYSFDGADLVSITGYVHARDHNSLDFDGTTANLEYFDEIQGTKDISQELQLLSTNNSRLQWVLGAYYSSNRAFISPLDAGNVPYRVLDADHNAIGSSAYFPAGAAVNSIVAHEPTRSLAAYAQATYAIGDNTHLTAGFRYTSERREYKFTVSGVGQIAPGVFLPTLTPLLTDDGQRKATFNKPSWRLALDHQFSPDILGYVSWNRGFKSGTFNMNDFTPSQAPVAPERLDAYEVGVKSKLFDRRLQINAAAFYYNYENIQVDIITGNPASPTVLQNAASEKIYGLDADILAEPVHNLRLSASVSWLHSRYGDYFNANAFVPDANGNGVAIAIPNAKGSRGLYSPAWSFTLGADYTVDLKNGGKLDFNSSYFRTDGYKTGNGPLDRVLEYDSLGASVTYTLPDDHFYVRAYGTNLTNRKIISYQLLQLKYSRNVIQPITYGIAFGARF